MYYFEKNGNYLYKYKVNVDKNKLLELRREIIDNCSEISNEEVISEKEPSHLENGFERRCIFKENESNKYSYLVYKYPYLVELIDRLLNNDNFAFQELNTLNVEKIRDINKFKKEKLLNDLEHIDDLDPDNKVKKYHELKELQKSIKLNENQKSIIPYYEEVKSLLKPKLIGCFLYDEILRFVNFLELDVNKLFVNVIEEDKNTLKLTKNKEEE